MTSSDVQSDTYHVMPVNDLIDHDSSGEEDCVCGPEILPVERDDGSMARGCLAPLPRWA